MGLEYKQYNNNNIIPVIDRLGETADISDKENKITNNNAGYIGMEFAYKDENLNARAQVEFLDDTEEDARDHYRVNELYVGYSSFDYELSVGRRIFFWGALEAYNFVDMLNLKDTSRDPLDGSNKLGAWVSTFTYFFEASQIDFIVKWLEEEQFFGDRTSPYVIYPYAKSLILEQKDTRPSMYTKWSGSTDTDYPIDYAFAYIQGYDGQRRVHIKENDLRNQSFSGEVQQYAYLSNKFLMYDTVLIESILYKLEFAYTDVINNKFHEKITDSKLPDYLQVGYGIEYTIEQIVGDTNLGFLFEHYIFYYLDEIKDSDVTGLPLLFDNDIFLGLRFAFNDKDSSELQMGTVYDILIKDKKPKFSGEATYFVKYQSRFSDSIGYNFDIRYITPGDSEDEYSIFKYLGDHTRASANIQYNF
jgi:hypothetical protein